MVRVAPEITDFYGEHFDEASRLTRRAEGVLELVRTQELLSARLPAPPAAVLDVGGGAGVHARWLTADGYRVHLVDPVARHVAAAPATGCTAELGDARELTAGDSSYDTVLLLGPLYHLPDPDDRARALREAVRVVRPGGLLAAAGISRYAALFDHIAHQRLHRPEVAGRLAESIRGGTHHPGSGFTTAYFHEAGELSAELAAAGLTGITEHPVEGPGWPQLQAVDASGGPVARDSPLFASVLAAARLADGRPDLAPVTAHYLAIARAPG